VDSLSPRAGGNVASGYDMRVGDAERDAAANDLREHFASGRLTQDELNERLDRTFAAKTRGDLSGLFTDLPSSTWQVTVVSPTPGRPQERWADWGESYGSRAMPHRADDAFGHDDGADGNRGGYGRRTLAGVLVPLMVVAALFTVALLSVFGRGGPRRRGGGGPRRRRR
jgi:hypothetical protein